MTSGSKRRAPANRQNRAHLDWRAIDKLAITGLETDSRRVKRGDTFVAYPGEKLDGRRFIPQAIARGARAILWERSGYTWPRSWRTANLGISQLRARSGLIASRVYGEPSARLLMVGVTGTNGKTTCSQWIASALTAAGKSTAVIGTLGAGIGRALKPIANTTPDAVWLHRQLAEYARRGARAVSMEVSSIGLDQDRMAGAQFDIALLTNLTRDHLDYHRTMRAYRTAKARLFACESLKYAIVNLDDAFGWDLATRLKRRGLKVIGYGFDVARGGRATMRATNLVADARGLRFDVTGPWGAAHVESTVLGRFNASNLLGTLTVLLASGMTLRVAVAALARLEPIRGRMQALGGGARPLAVIDYAHTPDALEKVLRALRELMAEEGHLICVFGCGGERDRGKRPLMGQVVAKLADRFVITSDNPRGENPRAIVDDILAGIDRTGALELDRKRAITGAIRGARSGDIVLIAGKGHEQYQEIAGVRRAFDDVEVAREALKRFNA